MLLASNFWNPFGVELTFNSREQNALEQGFNGEAKLFGPLFQECPIAWRNVVWSKVDNGVRRLALRMRLRDSIIRHGRFLSFNRDRSRLC